MVINQWWICFEQFEKKSFCVIFQENERHNWLTQWIVENFSDKQLHLTHFNHTNLVGKKWRFKLVNCGQFKSVNLERFRFYSRFLFTWEILFVSERKKVLILLGRAYDHDETNRSKNVLSIHTTTLLVHDLYEWFGSITSTCPLIL